MQRFLFLSNILENIKMVTSDSIFSPVVELINNPVAIRSEANNWGFILFFICFFIIASIIGNKSKFLFSMFSALFHNKGRHSMFHETVTHETLNKFFLSFQTILLLSIIVYCYAVHEHFLQIVTFAQMLFFIGKCSLLLIAFFLYKFFSYSVTGAIFFKKDAVIQWNDDFFSLICLNGIVLFLPALILFYVGAVYTFCIYFMVCYFIFNLFFIFYKLYVLFFQGNQRLLYFILYLCAQEVIPLYLVYRGFVYLITQMDTIWM
jgi:hypothetical protein